MDRMSDKEMIARLQVATEELLKRIPPEQRGVWFERTLMGLISDNPTSKLELSFTEEWARQNDRRVQRPMLEALLCTEAEGGINTDRQFVPKTKREWQVAHSAVATVINWLPTNVGCSFLREAFVRAGGGFRYRLPGSETFSS